MEIKVAAGGNWWVVTHEVLSTGHVFRTRNGNQHLAASSLEALVQDLRYRYDDYPIVCFTIDGEEYQARLRGGWWLLPEHEDVPCFPTLDKLYAFLRRVEDAPRSSTGTLVIDEDPPGVTPRYHDVVDHFAALRDWLAIQKLGALRLAGPVSADDLVRFLLEHGN